MKSKEGMMEGELIVAVVKGVAGTKSHVVMACMDEGWKDTADGVEGWRPVASKTLCGINLRDTGWVNNNNEPALWFLSKNIESVECKTCRDNIIFHKGKPPEIIPPHYVKHHALQAVKTHHEAVRNYKAANKWFQERGIHNDLIEKVKAHVRDFSKTLIIEDK